MIFYTLFFLLLCQFCFARVHDSEYDLLESNILKLRNLIANNGDTNAVLWGQLGMYLQTKDVKYHEDSARYQPEAVRFLE